MRCFLSLSLQLPWINDKTSAESWLKEHHPEIAEFRERLYAREKQAHFKPGTVLVYRHDVWHRGTPLKQGADITRLVVNLSFRRADAAWFNMWNRGWAYSMSSQEQTAEKLVARSSVAQRTVLGFPAPGHPYWTPATLRLVTRRYQHLGFDPAPYALALQPSQPSSST